MTELNLTLRQRQLINYLRHANNYVTGEELAHVLNTSSRTVRTDIQEINNKLIQLSVRIKSKHSFGYMLETDDENKLKLLTRATESYISRSERMRHIVLRLALSDSPINLDDFSDEMYISKTTLEHDLAAFRKEYLLKYPYIRLLRDRNCIFFENDELKRRIMICKLYADRWDYNGRGNAFFEYEYLNKDEISICMDEIRKSFSTHDISVEDVNMVYLDLIIAVSARRIKSGHVLIEKDGLENANRKVSISKNIRACINELLNNLENSLGCLFSVPERENIMEFTACCLLPDMDELHHEGISASFSSNLIRFTNEYLNTIRNTYHLDLMEDEDFYISLLIYLRYLDCPIHFLSDAGIDKASLLRKYAIEFELAFSIEPLALEYYGSYLDFHELFYISCLFTSALIRMPFRRLRTVILCHYNFPVAWNLRMQIENRFAQFLNITSLQPVYAKDTFDFNDTDLILVTVNKNIKTGKNIGVLQVSPWFTDDDIKTIETYIIRMRFYGLYGKHFPSIVELLDNAVWHERADENNFFELLTKMGNEMIKDGYVDETYLNDLLRHNSLETFALQPSYVLVHSSVPARKTHIKVTTLEHRIHIRGQKIRTVFMFCMRPEDIGLVFKLYNVLYLGIPHPEETRFFKTKEEWIGYLKDL